MGDLAGYYKNRKKKEKRMEIIASTFLYGLIAIVGLAIMGIIALVALCVILYMFGVIK